MDFEGQVAVITGGAQGIGGAVADALARSGARLAIWDLDEALAVEKAASLGDGAFACPVDVADWSSVEAAAARTLDAAGRIDICVNSAGIAGSNAPLIDYPVAEFRQIVEINLLGTFHVNRAVVPAMVAQDYGRIVNIASVAGKEGNPTASAYSSSKAGVMGLTKSLGKELAGHDIAVNCVTPAAARTRIFDQMSQEHIAF
ncbi:MAG: SDR family NAD(P)-dependent oxidoreductase, partial [Pseudomonadota bacterium]